jgi:hypothetical protein
MLLLLKEHDMAIHRPPMLQPLRTVYTALITRFHISCFVL